VLVPPEEESAQSLTIDELARETGMTARNIRAHQSRGLLPPPEVRARTGYYGDEHVARVRLIQDMQGQGFNLKAIERLLELGATNGSETALAFERAVLTPFGSEQASVVNTGELVTAFADLGDPAIRAEAERIGVLRPLGDDSWEIPSPTLMRAAQELMDLGIPFSQALAVGAEIRSHTTAIAAEFVSLYVRSVLDPLRDGERGRVPLEHLDQAREAVEKLRPLASEAVLASFGQVMTEAVEKQLQLELSR
jgi:DNA-binding transcriptional MerR regulator